MRSMKESELFPAIQPVSKEPKKKKILMQDFKFFPNPDRLKELFGKEQDAKFDPNLRLTIQENEEKDLLFSQGFLEWTRNDYMKFVQSLNLFAPDDYENISDHVRSKTLEEVKKFGKVF